jgi:hypothetical protein
MRSLSFLPATPGNEGAEMKRNEIPKTNFTMVKKITLIMVLCFTVFMAGMISLINNPNDQIGIWFSGYGLNAYNPVTRAGSPDCNQTDGWGGNMSSDTESRRSSGDGRPVILSLPTSSDHAGKPPVGFLWVTPTFGQATYALQINRFALGQRPAHADSKAFSPPDNPHAVEAFWLFACSVVGLAGLGRRRTV